VFIEIAESTEGAFEHEILRIDARLSIICLGVKLRKRNGKIGVIVCTRCERLRC